MTTKAPRTQKPALKADQLYSGDNGRIHCGALECAGYSAHFTGRGTSGERVSKLSASDSEYLRGLGMIPKCETCKRALALSYFLIRGEIVGLEKVPTQQLHEADVIAEFNAERRDWVIAKNRRGAIGERFASPVDAVDFLKSI